jgi:hypothetical protein
VVDIDAEDRGDYHNKIDMLGYALFEHGYVKNVTDYREPSAKEMEEAMEVG